MQTAGHLQGLPRDRALGNSMPTVGTAFLFFLRFAIVLCLEAFGRRMGYLFDYPK
jgi:hypothetical protein